MKKMIVLLCLLVELGCLIACGRSEYVREEPTYVASARPQSPGGSYIWIDGDWRFNRTNRNYQYQPGYWSTPRNGQHYYPGKWETNSKGHYWKSGGWRK